MRLTPEEQSSLLGLLLSPDDHNTALALELLAARNFPRAVLTEVFVIYKLTQDEQLRHQASNFLQHHPFMGLMHVMNSNLQLGQRIHLQPTEQTIKKNIDTYVALSHGVLDGLRFAQAMYRKYKIGLKYLLERLPLDERTALLRTFITGTRFKLSDSSLTTIPKELYQFKELTSIDLSYNKLKTLPHKIKQFAQLEELLLSNNTLVSLTPALRQLPNLRHLDVAHNKFKQVPAIITELTQLETLNMAQLNHLLLGETMTMPTAIQQLTQLKELSLSDQLAGYSQGLVLNYNGFPNFTTVTAAPDSTLDLDPLKLAQYAYDQNGKSEGLLYLFAHSDDPQLLEDIIRDQFYKAETQTLDLKATMLLALPDVLRQFTLRKLQLRGCYLGTQHYTYGTKNAYRQWALHDQAGIDEVFAALEDQHQLEEADLSRNRLQSLPHAMQSWTALRHLDLSQNVLYHLPKDWTPYANLEVLDLSNNQLRQLEVDWSVLQQLRVLYLNNNQLQQLPEVLGQLHHLEELYLINALQPQTEPSPPLEIPDSWAGLRSLKKLHLYEPSLYKAHKAALLRLHRLLPRDCTIHLAYA